ncbi:hypothetical protein BKA65DRAFT_576291 [Rhexocercosporidium sp. MPI-PUGE-AT-0058]|nr:hypothetical protein BKA65DRAFT_576291 [Rhexocercosporidium sp. MPI-PUGE-AT-0058]
MALSTKRKADAESGDLHRTARKLSSLFQNVIPNVEGLFRAYGTRVSEISSSLQVNRNSNSSSFFTGEVGVDSASIWAAVTSGSGAIAMNLLACMLAHCFKAPEAVSIWTELVAEQRRLLDSEGGNRSAEQNKAVSILADFLEITHSELSLWDAGARSWIQTADTAKLREHKRFMLIIQNIILPVNRETESCQRILGTFRHALEITNNLLLGIPQQDNGGALVAMSAWHLYPDMLLLGHGGVVTVKHKNPLFTWSAILTVGLLGGGARNESESWSLSLSHLDVLLIHLILQNQ